MRPSEQSALRWLQDHGGDGVFIRRGSVLLAAGEAARVSRRTWASLEGRGLVERYANGVRLRLSLAGGAVILRGVEPAPSWEDDFDEDEAPHDHSGFCDA